jgi:hypothetical protein
MAEPIQTGKGARNAWALWHWRLRNAAVVLFTVSLFLRFQNHEVYYTVSPVIMSTVGNISHYQYVGSGPWMFHLVAKTWILWPSAAFMLASPWMKIRTPGWQVRFEMLAVIFGAIPVWSGAMCLLNPWMSYDNDFGPGFWLFSASFLLLILGFLIDVSEGESDGLRGVRV